MNSILPRLVDLFLRTLANQTEFCPNALNPAYLACFLNGSIVTTELPPKLWSDEPVRVAVSFLRRIAFFILFGLVPALSPVSKRSLTLFSTIGAALFILSAVIEGQWITTRRLIWSPPVIAGLGAGFVYVFWGALSLIWTPFPLESLEHYLSYLMIIALGLIVIALMPERVSASRLYGLAIGVTIGLLLSIAVKTVLGDEGDLNLLRRALILLSLLIPPVAVWLIYRRRDSLAILLAMLAALASVMTANWLCSFALLIAFVTFVAALIRPEQTRIILATVCGLAIVLSPLIPFLLTAPLGLAFGEDHILTITFADWLRLIADEPFRLLTGHGFDTISRAIKAGLAPANVPRGLLVDTWYELGIIGAVALAVFIAALIMLSSAMTRPCAAAMQASLVGALVIATVGGNVSQTSWTISIVLGAFAIAALHKGQYKTARPVSSDIGQLNAKRSRFLILPDSLRF